MIDDKKDFKNDASDNIANNQTSINRISYR